MPPYYPWHAARMYSKNIIVDSEDEDPDKTLNLIILGLPYKTTEDDIREYFEPFGEILMVQLKKRPGSGESKGFAFIKFADKEVEKKVGIKRMKDLLTHFFYPYQ